LISSGIFGPACKGSEEERRTKESKTYDRMFMILRLIAKIIEVLFLRRKPQKAEFHADEVSFGCDINSGRDRMSSGIRCFCVGRSLENDLLAFL
jgi:hypothetical protein